MRTFEEIAINEGWTPETQVAVLLQYIANQQDDDALSEFCERQIEEVAMSDGMIGELERLRGL